MSECVADTVRGCCWLARALFCSAEGSGSEMSTKVRPFYKVIIIGDKFVGKTALLERFVNKVFSAQYKATIGLSSRRFMRKVGRCCHFAVLD